jgi:hypothetical protein
MAGDDGKAGIPTHSPTRAEVVCRHRRTANIWCQEVLAPIKEMEAVAELWRVWSCLVPPDLPPETKLYGRSVVFGEWWTNRRPGGIFEWNSLSLKRRKQGLPPQARGGRPGGPLYDRPSGVTLFGFCPPAYPCFARCPACGDMRELDAQVLDLFMRVVALP